MTPKFDEYSQKDAVLRLENIRIHVENLLCDELRDVEIPPEAAQTFSDILWEIIDATDYLDPNHNSGILVKEVE